jgi:hypothetical protein
LRRIGQSRRFERHLPQALGIALERIVLCCGSTARRTPRTVLQIEKIGCDASADGCEGN